MSFQVDPNSNVTNSNGAPGVATSADLITSGNITKINSNDANDIVIEVTDSDINITKDTTIDAKLTTQNIEASGELLVNNASGASNASIELNPSNGSSHFISARNDQNMYLEPSGTSVFIGGPGSKQLSMTGGNSFSYVGSNLNALGEGLQMAYNYNVANNSIPNAGGASTRVQLNFNDVAIFTSNGVANQTPTTEVARFTANGNVGIGTSTPVDKLQVNGTTRTTDLNVSNESLLNGTSRFGGNVGINEMNPSHELDVNGTIRCNNIIPDDISLPILTEPLQIESTDDLGSRFNFRVFDDKHLFIEGIFKELDQQQPNSVITTNLTNFDAPMKIYDNGNIGIGNIGSISAVEKLYVRGNIINVAPDNDMAKIIVRDFKTDGSSIAELQLLRGNFDFGTDVSVDWKFKNQADFTIEKGSIQDTGFDGEAMRIQWQTGNTSFFGSVTAPSFVTISDERVKEDIKEFTEEEAINLINDLKPKKYKYKYHNRGKETYGFLAQEYKKVLPNAVCVGERKFVYYDEETAKNETVEIQDLHTVKKDVMFPLMVKTIQNLLKRVEETTNENKKLNERISKIEEKLLTQTN